jgi:DNA polymerase-1
MSLAETQFPGGIWCVDFEFHPLNGREGNPPVPLCLVAHELASGRIVRVWREELFAMSHPPFPVDASALLVGFYASAEISCFLALNWPLPRNVLDLYVEFRWMTNGKPRPCGNSLLGAMAYFGLAHLAAAEKEELRALILSCGPWNDAEKQAILDYCASDVRALVALFPALVASGLDWPRALLRGRYVAAVAAIERRGIPMDVDTLDRLKARWQVIQQGLIQRLDRDYGVYDGMSFRSDRFKHYLARAGIPWPLTAHGHLCLDDNTFRDMSRSYPRLQPLRELRMALSQMRLADLPVGDDGRNRCLLSIFQSKTSRNQPSNARFIFGPSVWLRGLIKPTPGYGLAYLDWNQQEFGIAAALSRDPFMRAAYQSGDPYLEFARQAGAVPPDATRKSHGTEREQFKQCVLAVQYGMGAESLALRLGQPTAKGRQLLALHRHTYRQFWRWTEGILNEALLRGRLWTAYGWQLFATDQPNARSLGNYPMQANGAEMLRLACIRLIEDGIQVCAPIHDALLIEAPLAELDDAIRHTQNVMRWASAMVLDGFELTSDAKRITYPHRYADERGIVMWNAVMLELGCPERCIQPES